MVVLACGMSLALSPPARAESADTEPDTSYAAGLPDLETVGLSLDQAQRLAAANSPSSRAAVAALRSARGARMKEAGAFDPVLTAAEQKVSTDTPVSSPFAGSKLRSRSRSGGLAWLSPLGTSVNLTLSQLRSETNAPFATLSPERDARARIDFVQPLWHGFGPAAARGELRALDREVESARAALAAATLDLSADVENAYWDLYAAEHRLGVERLLRQRAAVFLRDQVLRGRAGVVGPGAVAIARTFLAQQETALLDARIAAAGASDHLAQVMGARPQGEALYRCLDEPAPAAAVEPLSSVLARAFAANPSLRAARADSGAAQARARRAAWNAWPTLEAFGGYGASGLAGVGRQVVLGTDTIGTVYDTGFDQAWTQVGHRDFPDWNFGVRLRLPIGWRADRGERERVMGSYDRAREALRARQLALESEVRAAHREADIASRELDAAGTLVQSAEEQARIARLEYQAGRGTAYDLVNLEGDLAAARQRETEVKVRIAHATTELRRLTLAAPGGTKR
ncbi:MAG: TolC family protein [Candidatus Eisenbacteria bacterium]|uniref:TolC family protein n=1 Tax=Eiseniibacteriota bacterium TaxID=2212470 RepID=A0A538UDW9_UNCEI|nr:MAG: TolC family protein [Candidatus Eisenbacteria bacterium]